LGLIAFLAACDDGTVITHVDKDTSIELSDLVAMQSHGGIATEVHGTPFEGTASDELVNALRPPASAAQATRWRMVDIGSVDHGPRMVLHFNPSGPPNSFADCRRTGPAETEPPRGVGFSVNMTFCRGTRAEAHGFLQSRKTANADFEDYRRVMKLLMRNIFSDAGHDR
ncbi:MAG: hypothetical protein AAF317_12570, partial [Pseudomonadota bacterium]